MVNNMPQKIQVFEKEEATKLLDYFVAYKKLQNKLEYIKCVAALNPVPNNDDNKTCTRPNLQMSQINENIVQPSIDLSQHLEK
jgi:hypothetical protein